MARVSPRMLCSGARREDESDESEESRKMNGNDAANRVNPRIRRRESPLHREVFVRSRQKEMEMPVEEQREEESAEARSNIFSERDEHAPLEQMVGLDEVSDPHDKRSEIFPTDGLRVLAHGQESEKAKQDRLTGYRVFRAMAPYIAVHRNSVVVIHIPGEVLESELVDDILHDIILLKTLGVKPVLVAGCRPQVRKRLETFGIRSFFVKGNRVCDEETLAHCQSVAGHVRVEIESKLSRGLLNAPIGTGVGSVSVVSGNLVRAIPYGVRGGIDYKLTGVVQKVEAKRILSLLDQGDIVLLGHLGYSQSALVFHCRSEEVAVKAAIDLHAEKLVFFHNGESVIDVNRGKDGILKFQSCVLMLP